MLLKEFELDAPRETRERRRRFRHETRCITALFERSFPVFTSKDCWKAIFECVRTVKKEKYRNLLGAYALEIAVNLDEFFDLPPDQKKEWAAGTLLKGTERLLQQTSWPPEVFFDTFNRIKELQLVNHWIWKKPLPSPSRKYIAEVQCEHEIESFDVFLSVRDEDDAVIRREKVISSVPDELAYARHLGELKWSGETIVVLRNKKRDRSWEMDLAAPEKGFPRQE